MKVTSMVMLLASLTAAANAGANRNPDLIVYLHHGTESAAIFGLAEGQADRMLARAGISVAWRLGDLNYHGPAETIEVVLKNQPDDNFKPGALAFATLGPNSGTRIEIFYNRITAVGNNSLVPFILAHVLVHEITHVLEGIDRHSESGVMKAHWNEADFGRMRSSLPFADEDLRLLHNWSVRHHQIMMATR